MAGGLLTSPDGSVCFTLPHIERDTAVVDRVFVPRDRGVFFVALPCERLSTTGVDDLSFAALSREDTALFQLMLYATYCCKGTVLQVTLENPDLLGMSLSIREDFGYGRLFCFVLNLTAEDGTLNAPRSDDNALSETDDDDILGSLAGVDVDMGVFTGTDRVVAGRDDERAAVELYNAFMRLQLVRKRVSSLNNAMVIQRDAKNDFGSVFSWLDIDNDVLHASKLDKKIIKNLQGSLYTPSSQYGKHQAATLPDGIVALNLKNLETAVGRITDTVSSRDSRGRRLFQELARKLTGSELSRHEVFRHYNASIDRDVSFLDRVKRFATRLATVEFGEDTVDTEGLIVFRYTLHSLIDHDEPGLFTKTLMHKHVPVSSVYIEATLREMCAKNRTKALVDILTGRCNCPPGARGEVNYRATAACSGRCEIAQLCFYNQSTKHPVALSKQEDEKNYFARLYPHLGRLERLSKELKQSLRNTRGDSKRFELIADTVCGILVNGRIDDQNALYRGIRDVVSDQILNSDMSIGYHLPKLHAELCAPANRRQEHNPLKVYDKAVVEHLFVTHLQVGRLFQASTTFNYIITNTAPRYTTERFMLFNNTGPGEGKSYANKVLTEQFKPVSDCVKTLSSFTPQAFKYKQNRTAAVLIIDDAHVTHEKTNRALDKESNVIPNTFKNLLDNSILESEVVTKNPVTGRSDTVSYQVVHNCGYVWNTNTMVFVSEAWAGRSMIMESEHSTKDVGTRSSKQLVDIVEHQDMARVTQICLYRQNLVQCATMIANSDAMQFTERYDVARKHCMNAIRKTHIVGDGLVDNRIDGRINHLVYAEALKLACHFVFDLWIPPWTKLPTVADFLPDNFAGYATSVNAVRLQALNELSFGHIALEVNAVCKLCAAACLPDICPRVLDMQARFVGKILSYILTAIHAQSLNTSITKSTLTVSQLEKFQVDDTAEPVKGVSSKTMHELLMLSADCRVPIRQSGADGRARIQLCNYKLLDNARSARKDRSVIYQQKKVSSVSVPLEIVYDLLALYAPLAHAAFWAAVSDALLAAYRSGSVENATAMAQCCVINNGGDPAEQIMPHYTFTLDFTEDPVQATILEAAAGVCFLNELTFEQTVLGGIHVYRCSAPVYYGGVIVHRLGASAPQSAHNENHMRESRVGPVGTFHGPRLCVYSLQYSGAPVENMSSFCTSRTVYHQDKIVLRHTGNDRDYISRLEPDWEWLDAADVFNSNRNNSTLFTPDMLKLDYALTMVCLKKLFQGTMVYSNRTDKALRQGGRPFRGDRCRTSRSTSSNHRFNGDNNKQIRKRPINDESGLLSGGDNKRTRLY